MLFIYSEDNNILKVNGFEQQLLNMHLCTLYMLACMNLSVRLFSNLSECEQGEGERGSERKMRWKRRQYYCKVIAHFEIIFNSLHAFYSKYPHKQDGMDYLSFTASRTRRKIGKQVQHGIHKLIVLCFVYCLLMVCLESLKVVALRWW